MTYSSLFAIRIYFGIFCREIQHTNF